jgi:S-disulfanyl-L-cysteine oxidoreductase SoxD
MYSRKLASALARLAGCCLQPANAHNFGRPARPEEIALWNIDIRPDGQGLPIGKGTVEHGKTVYEQNCAACHGVHGEGGIGDRLVGGQGTLTSDHPIKTIGSYWPYATTLLDYVHRAMPYQAPGSLSIDDYYAVTAYLLDQNGIHSPGGTLDQRSILKIKMPNRNGFIPEPEFTKFKTPF